MNLHEYQAKAILAQRGLPTLAGQVVQDKDTIAEQLSLPAADLYVVKAQIHAGGRGEGHMPDDKGGVRFAKTHAEAKTHVEAMLGNVLVTKQTGDAGKVVNTVYIETGAQFDQQIYMSLLVDRATNAVTFVSSAEGGTSIEELAESNPEKISTIAIDPVVGIGNFHILRQRLALGLDKSYHKPLGALMRGLYQAFIDLDATLLEINPLVTVADSQFLLLDAKLSVDDNALYRHPELAELRDATEEDPMELEAAANDLNYVKLDGTIGCMVNGAGLAMATMDTIQRMGGTPANFLDVGGGATKDRVTFAFKLILSDRNVKGILVNIFGGIMRCDIIAEGIIAACRELELDMPLVVRLAGTNVEQGKQLLADSGLPLTPAANLTEAAELIIAQVGKL